MNDTQLYHLGVLGIACQSVVFLCCWAIAWQLLPAVLAQLGRYACALRHGWPPLRTADKPLTVTWIDPPRDAC